MALHEVLVAKHDEVMLRWKAQVRGTLALERLPTLELVDHIPAFMDEIVAALRKDAGLSTEDPSSEERKTAARHGAQRLRLGFSLDSVVREYGALRDAIVATARDSGAQPSFREHDVLVDAIVSGIAHAVSEYANQRDAELARQANEHFAFIAHELRDPLSSATMAFQLLKRKGQLVQGSGASAAIERDLRRASELIDQTLQAARVASGIELRPQPTTLKALFEEAHLASVSEAEFKDIEIRLLIEADEQVNLDSRLVRSALVNLIRNGVKYTSSGSVIEVRGRILNSRAVIEVEDSCGGLATGDVEEAFTPFARLDDSQSGFGLGLAIAKQAVTAHGGNIRVQNLPGKGCIFVLELPVQAESSQIDANATAGL